MDRVRIGMRERIHRARSLALTGGLTGALVLGALPASVPAAAAIAPQSETTWETGVISGVADGDTVHVDIRTAADPQFVAPANTAARSYCDERVGADGSMPADGDLDRCRVRLIGIQAPEKAGAAGGSALEQCRAAGATAALARVLPVGTPVQLRSISVRSVESNYSGGRLARTVYYQSSPGTWVDAGRAVMAGGHAMWFPHTTRDAEKPEYARNLDYRRLLDAAAAARRGLWSADLCGPSAAASVRTWVVSDPIGNDAGNEHLVLRNDSAAPLAIGGWTVRDASLTTFTFPAGTVIGPRDHVRVFAGSGAPGTPTARDFHFGGPSQMFNNWDPAAGYFHGDGGYVYDAQPGYAYGNLRTWFHYPCDGASCSDPLVGRIRFGTISYNPPGSDTAAGEYAEVVNTSGAPVALGGYAFTRRGSQFPFPANMVLPAGATLRVSMGTGTDTASTVHLGRTSSLLANSGDLLALANLNHAPVDCRAWGGYSCTGKPVSGPLLQPGDAAPPPPAPVTTAPAPTSTTTSPAPTPTRAAKRPGAPRAVRVKAKKRRLVVRWAAPQPNGSKRIKKYRAKVYRVKANGKLKYRTKCFAKAKKRKCRTKKLKRRTTYVVKVQARNKKGYGQASTLVRYRLK
jgi:endonuclease YncB( thermonuclease family)